MIFSFQILSFILATLLCFRHRRERSSFLHMTARCSFDPCAGRSCVWGTILNALRVALRINSGKNIYNFGIAERLRALRYPIFTGGELPQSKPDGFDSSLWEGASGTPAHFAFEPETVPPCQGPHLRGGCRANARLGEFYPSTCSKWRRERTIKCKHWLTLIQEIELVIDDFDKNAGQFRHKICLFI